MSWYDGRKKKFVCCKEDDGIKERVREDVF